MPVYPPPTHVTCLAAVFQKLRGVSQELRGMVHDRFILCYGASSVPRFTTARGTGERR